MSTTRKQTNANTQQPPNYIPPYYPYPGYGYISPQLYNPAYVDPYTYPTLPYDEPEYVYYPTDDYGNAVGPPSRFPPINSRYSEGYYPYPDYTPNVPSYVPYIPSPRIDPMAYNGYYNYYQDPYIHRGNERPRREASPPKRKNSFASPRPAPSSNHGFQQFMVHDKTYDSDSVSPRNGRRDIQQSDRRRKTHHK